MKNIRDLRAGLIEVFEGLKNGSVKAADATEMNNAAGKIINSLKMELQYAAQRKETPEIAFLESETDIKS